MTSIAFNIHHDVIHDPHDGPHVLHGHQADGWERRAEAARRERQGQPSERERSSIERERLRLLEERRNGRDRRNDPMTENNGNRGLELADRPRIVQRGDLQRAMANAHAGQRAMDNRQRDRAGYAAQRFQAIGGLPLNLDNLDYEQLHEMFPSHPRQGITPAVLEQCTNVFRFKQNALAVAEAGGGADEKPLVSCPICLVDFEDGDQIRMLPCLHAYHKDCADQWLKTNCCCPMCKTNVKTLVSDTPRITGKANGLGLAFGADNAQQAQGAQGRARVPLGRVQEEAARMGAAAQRAINSLQQGHAAADGERHAEAEAGNSEGLRRVSSLPESAPTNRDHRLGRDNPAWRRLRMEELERERQRQREVREEQEAAAALTDEVDIYREVLQQHRRVVYSGNNANANNGSGGGGGSSSSSSEQAGDATARQNAGQPQSARPRLEWGRVLPRPGAHCTCLLVQAYKPNTDT